MFFRVCPTARPFFRPAAASRLFHARACVAPKFHTPSALLRRDFCGANGCSSKSKVLFGEAWARRFSNVRGSAQSQSAWEQEAAKQAAASRAESMGRKSEQMGRTFVAVAATGGLGALCYYGAGLAPEAGAIDTAQFWPAFVRERVRVTFAAFAAGLAMTAGQTYLLFNAGFAHRLMAANPWLVLGGSVAAMFGSQMLLRSIDYESNKMMKLGAFAVFTGCTAAMISPIMILGGALVVRAAAYTAVVVGGLSAVAACAPGDQFLYAGGPLACGLGLVICASLGGMIFPAYAAVSHSIYTYGGLVLFSGYLMYDMQKILHVAQIRDIHYDPVNMSVGIYMDTINIFIRIATILAGGNSKRR